MYRLMRNTHLVLGLVFALALGVYLLSSVRIAHQSWFTPNPTTSETSLAVDPDQAGTPRDLRRQLRQRHGLRGDLVQVRTDESASYSFVVRRPGSSSHVHYELGASKATVSEERAGVTGLLLGLHFSYGVFHEDIAANLWGAVLFLTSLGLLAIGATGIYLWFKTQEERLAGCVLLAASLGFAATMLIGIRINT
ncbi:MAG: PepSY domain-containing protein [Bryobacterales bacterium]|nr:PepSY domain-containing protein [Bryobacterales bacterium]